MRGQRLEPAEIEQVIMNATSDVHECLVMKVEHGKQDYLVAYLASTVPQNEEKKLIAKIEEACCLLLPPIKRPSFYRILHENKLQRSPNGKIIRSALPQPMISIAEPVAATKSLDEISVSTEYKILQLWQQILLNHGSQKKIDISLDTNWYQLGGDSLGIMKLIGEYRRLFVHDKVVLPMAQLIQQATILNHKKILDEALIEHQRENSEHTTHFGQLQRVEAMKGREAALSLHVCFS